MYKLLLSTIFVVFISALLNGISDAGYLEAELFKTCNASVSSKESIFVSYKIQNCSYKEKFLRIKFETNLKDNQTISINSESDRSAFQLVNINNESIVSTEKTICSNSQMKSCEENEVFLLKMKSNSPESILVNFTGDLIDYVKMNIGENLSITVNDHNSTYVLLKFNDTNKDMKIIIKSEDDQCMIAFIEKTGCTSNILYPNIRHKIITKGSIPIKNYGEFKDNSLLVVFMLIDNKYCKKYSENQNVLNGKQFKQKNFNITFVNVITSYNAVWKLIGIYIGIFYAYCGLFAWWIYYCYVKNGDYRNPSKNLIVEGSENTIESPTKNNGKWYSYCCLGKYYSFCKLVFTISVFCGLPIVLLLLNFFKIMDGRWNYDNCYFNDYCSKPLGSFVAFNKIISNIGYIFFGLIFMLCVNKSRSYMDESSFQYSNNGIFYALGFCLIIEGIMNASYHICPRFNIIHLETIFIIIIGCLLNLYCAIQLLQIFYKNKLNIIKKTNEYFFFMSIVLLTIIILLFIENKTPWIAMVVFHVIFILISSINIFNVNNVKCSLDFGKLFSFLFVLINIIIFILGFSLKMGFCSYFLVVLFVNFEVLLVEYYVFIFSKKIRNSKQNIFQSIIRMIWNNLFISCHFLVFVILWIILFHIPAASNGFNEDCTLWNFYGIHDIWHILASLAIFLSFMCILLIDGEISEEDLIENT